MVVSFFLFVSFSINGLRAPLPGDLATAVSVGDVREVDALLARGADPDQFDATGQTPLLYALLSGRYELVSRMLRTTADPNLAGKGGLTPLMAAVRSSREDLVVLLLSSGADPNRISDIDSVPSSPMSIAINRGDFAMTHRLFENGADPRRLRNADTGIADPLNLPVVNIPLDLRIWQDLGEIRDSADSPDWNATVGGDPWLLHRAALSNDWNGARDAIDGGAAVNAADERGTTPMMVAAWHGHPSIVSLLLQRGADPLVLDNRGRGALAYASAAGELNTVERLLSVPKLLETEKFGHLDELRHSPIYYSLIASEPTVLKILLNAELPAVAEDSEKVTLLMMAAWLGDLRSTGLLLSVSDVGARDVFGRSALAWSAAAFDRDRRGGREVRDTRHGSEIYPVVRMLASHSRNPLLYTTQPTADMYVGSFDAALAWSPGRNPLEADALRMLKPSPVPQLANDGDMTLFRIFRDEEPGIPSSDR